MYVHHKEEQQDAIVARVERRHGKCQAAQSSGGGNVNIGDMAKTYANTIQSSDKLVVKDKIKEVLCSCLMISDTDADNLCNEICGQEKG